MKINQRGQSALEYLMTYGWALVVIVIVVAALVLLVGNPSSNDVCSQPGTSFSINNQDLNAGTTGGWNIRLSNISGKPMSSLRFLSVTQTGATLSSSQADANSISATTLTPGQQVVIWTKNSAAASGVKTTTTFAMDYSDGDFTRAVSFNCNGTA